MSTSLVASDSLLAIDVGAVNTRALLFDIVEGGYRFVAAGSAPSTAGAPFRDIGEGIHRALEQLQTITGRTILDSDARPIIPSQPDGSGVDACVATLSAGGPLKIAAVGLLEDVSTESAIHLASTTYAQIVETLSLNDRRKAAVRIDSILRTRPDLVVVAGGTDGGASKSVMDVLETIGLACYLLPEAIRPEVLFAGNQALAEEVQSSMQSFSSLHIAPNIRPALEVEQLNPAQVELAQMYRLVRLRKLAGVQELDLWTNNRLLPTAVAFGRVVRYLGHIHNNILGVDVGASATVLASSFGKEFSLNVSPHLGMGESLAGLLRHASLEEIVSWLTIEIPHDYLRDYLYNKSVHPATLPATPEDLAIEQSLVRVVLAHALKRASVRFPSQAQRLLPAFLPSCDLIVAAGSSITHAPTPGQSLLMLLDALQPCGITDIRMDRSNMLPALGAAATVNPVLTVQVIEPSAFPLGSIISLVGQASYGTPALKVRVRYANGTVSETIVKYGAVETLPVPMGQYADVELQLTNRFNIGYGPGKGKTLRLLGGALGVVIDARGRPLKLPPDPARRRELIKKWLWHLGG